MGCRNTKPKETRDIPTNIPPPPFRAPGVVERRRKRCTLPMCVLFISIVEISFYCLVLILFTIGYTLFKGYPELDKDRKVATILRLIVMSFAGVYVILAVFLLIGVLKKARYLVLIWALGALILMALEWIAVVVSVALLLNGALFFISGGYGPLRLCFICLSLMYYQRLKYGKATVVPVVERMGQGDGYQMVDESSVIFNQPLSNASSASSIHLNFDLNRAGSDQSLI